MGARCDSAIPATGRFDEVRAGVTVFGSPGLITARAGYSALPLFSRRDNTENAT